MNTITRPILVALLLAPLAVTYAADDGPFPEGQPFDLVDGVRFYNRIVKQPWRSTEDVIDGFDWSLPESVKPAVNGFMFIPGYAPDPSFPGNLIGRLTLSWQKLEPEEGHYDFALIDQGIERLMSKGYAAVELHVPGSVWDVHYYDKAGKLIPPDQLDPRRKHVRKSDTTAPRWLDKYNIPHLDGGAQLGADDHVVNLDIFHPDYHSRYLRLMAELGKSGKLNRKEIGLCYIHMVSTTRGEENDGAFPGQRGHVQVAERLRAWADAFGADRHKLCFTGHHPENLKICYDLGIGQRNGYIERYLLYTQDPAFGQSIDANGYLVTDESNPAIAKDLAFGDENEEYDAKTDMCVVRFGPRSTWTHRYREATLRLLEMRRNYCWNAPQSPDPFLTAWEALELGRGVNDAPDAWCYLRESYVHEHNENNGKVVPVKNFERWLYQRDAPGYETHPVHKVEFPEPAEHFVQNVYVKGYNYDYVARQGKRFGFAIDDRFLSRANQSVAIKITYYDDKPWKLVYPTANGPGERMVPCRGDGALRTATFFPTDAHFTGKNLDHIFEVHALGDSATLRFVRVVRLQPTIGNRH